MHKSTFFGSNEHAYQQVCFYVVELALFLFVLSVIRRIFQNKVIGKNISSA